MSVKKVFRPIERWPRELTPAGDRRDAPFVRANKWEKDAAGNTKRIPGGATPVTRTYADLDREMRHFGIYDGGEVIIERALRERDFRQDGGLRADAARPQHPGVILKFTGNVAGRPTPLSFACDVFKRWEDNLRAIVLTLEHLRGADRYGVTNSGEQYRGWNALPPAIALAMTVEEAARKLAKYAGCEPSAAAAIVSSKDTYRDCWRAAARTYHPDSNDGAVLQEWHELQPAKEVLDKHHGV
jgi:hypothetical protein